MQRDIPRVNETYRIAIADDIIDFIRQGKRKSYIDNNNISMCLSEMIESLSSIKQINDPTTYADCSFLSFGFNFNSNFAIENRRHIVFHELTHSIANLRNQNEGEYKLKDDNKGILKINNRTDSYEPIITNRMITFLKEIIAESTACDLAETYKPIKTMVVPGIFSDWLVLYNRSYQELGYEFLKTLTNNPGLDDRTLFRSFTMKAINNNDSICSDIIEIFQSKNPESWKDDLHKISEILGDISHTHILDDSKIRQVRSLMEKYQPEKKSKKTENGEKPTFNVKSRNDGR